MKQASFIGHKSAYTAELVSLPDERRVRPLTPLRRQMDLTQARLEMRESGSEIQLVELCDSSRIDAHHVFCVNKYQAAIKCSVICWRERKPIPYLIRAAGSCDRKNVGGFNQTKLHPRDGATVPRSSCLSFLVSPRSAQELL